MNEIKINLEPVFNKLVMKLKNKSPLMMKISGIMLDEVHQNFDSQGRPAWRVLAQKTIEDRRRKGHWPGKILQRKGGGGGLLGSITNHYDDNSSQVGTNKIYAALHQFGGTINQAARSSIYTQTRYSRGDKKGKFKHISKSKRQFGEGFTFKARTFTVPPRPFLSISDQGIKDIEQAIVDYLRK